MSFSAESGDANWCIAGSMAENYLSQGDKFFGFKDKEGKSSIVLHLREDNSFYEPPRGRLRGQGLEEKWIDEALRKTRKEGVTRGEAYITEYRFQKALRKELNPEMSKDEYSSKLKKLAEEYGYEFDGRKISSKLAYGRPALEIPYLDEVMRREWLAVRKKYPEISKLLLKILRTNK